MPHIDPAWIVAGGGALGSAGWLGQYLNSRREQRRHDRLEPEGAQAEAFKTGAEGFEFLIRGLRDEVQRLSTQVTNLSGELDHTRLELVSVRADLAVAATENRRLRREVEDLNATIRSLRNSH